MEARTTTRLGKVLSFFGVMLLMFGLLQGGAGAANNGKGKSSAPGQSKKAPAVASAAANSASNAESDCGSYCSTSDGTPSANGNGGGNGNQPCAGCVGNADNKNPPGQYKDGSDHNNGYECDGNNGVGKGNPAHSGCKPTTTTAPPQTTTTVKQTTTTVQQTTTTQPQTTTTAPLTTTTTAAGATTTTVAVGGSTTTTAEVLGVQFSRGDEQARGLASTGAAFFRPFTMLGALLLLLGVALMTIKFSPMARA
ncbi:MAG: hypothetical protein QOG87_1757 [Actinomycetota bacterium]